MNRKSKQGELFPPRFGLVEDSCIVAAHRANKEFFSRDVNPEECSTGQETEQVYMATDDDLPRIFFESVADAERRIE